MRALTAAALALLAAAAQARTLGTIAFTDCQLEGSGPSSRTVSAECARYDVPEDPAKPDGRRITLQLALVPARSTAAEPDPVVLLAGGPGQSAIEAYPDVVGSFEYLRRHRHVLLVDQRGTGKSNPLKCPLPDWKDPAAQTPAALRRQTVDCLATLTKRSDPAHYTTTDAVRDLETLRQALGAPRFNLVGASYGTRVALEYLRRHEDGVRTIVLDSAVPPELALLQDHSANLDDALARSFEACRQDAACAKRFGDPSATLARLRARLKQAQPRQDIADPRTHVPVSEVFNEDLLAAVIRLYSYQTEATALLPLLIDEAASGRPQTLLAQAELLYQRLSDSMAHGMELSVLCTEDEPFLKPRPEDAGTLLGTQLLDFAKAQCALWPRSQLPADFKQPVKSARPVLLLTGELDPVTPPRYAAQVVKTLPNGRALVLKGQGHSVMSRGCAPQVVGMFVDRAEARSFDVSCLDVLAPMPFFTSFQGPEP